jgi:hypothetical protein
MPPGFLKGAQLLKTSEYWMITGLIDQTLIDIQAGDYGGELDSGGQDERGNPIGGLLYSSAFAADGTPSQIQWWTEFIGSNGFCIKICNPAGTNNAGYCQHTLDRIGLAYNCPSKYTLDGGAPEGEFEVCDSDLMTVPGIYVKNGQTLSYSQPPESLGPITSIPYSPSLVASSNCVTAASSDLIKRAHAATTTPAAPASAPPSGPTSGPAVPSTSGSQMASASSSPTAPPNSSASGPAVPSTSGSQMASASSSSTEPPNSSASGPAVPSTSDSQMASASSSPTAPPNSSASGSGSGS